MSHHIRRRSDRHVGCLHQAAVATPNPHPAQALLHETGSWDRPPTTQPTPSPYRPLHGMLSHPPCGQPMARQPCVTAAQWPPHPAFSPAAASPRARARARARRRCTVLAASARSSASPQVNDDLHLTWLYRGRSSSQHPKMLRSRRQCQQLSSTPLASSLRLFYCYGSCDLRWRWRWVALCGCLAFTLIIAALTVAHVWHRSVNVATPLCPVDMAAVSVQYEQLAQHHLLDVRGYGLLPPHSITAAAVSSTHQQHDDVTRYRWNVHRQRTWWQLLWNSPAVVVLVTKDGRELDSVPASARSYLRVTQRMLQELVDNWQPRQQLPPYMDLLINTNHRDKLSDHNNSASSTAPPTTAPIFSSCSTQSAADVPFVYAESWKTGGVYKQVESQLLLTMSHVPQSAVTLSTGEQCVDVAAFTTQQWAAKRPTAIWRGSTTGGLYTPSTYHTFTRYQLALLSYSNPTGLIDAKLTHCTQCEPVDEVERLLGEQLTDHFDRDVIDAERLTRYRALIDVDGNSWSSRLPQLLASGAAVLKQSSPYREFWYDLLQPNDHYIDVARDLSDLESVVELAVERVERGGKVAMAALLFARQFLTADAVRLYAQHVLTEYATLLEVPKE